MDIDIRDWMIIIGVLLILAVLLDGYRRMRNDPNKVRVSLVEVTPETGDEEAFSACHELPNGGARVVPRAAGTETGAPATPEPAESPPLPEAISMTAVAGDENLDLLSGMSGKDRDYSLAHELPDGVESEVVMMHVTARSDDGFSGEDILRSLLACHMRFGEMNFFHRHQQAVGRGAIQFSVANMMQPGVFDIDAMSELSTRGLVFFLTLPGPGDMMAAFELMLETAECVAKDLDGDLLDESRSVATRQTQEHIRQRIRDLKRRLLTRSKR